MFYTSLLLKKIILGAVIGLSVTMVSCSQNDLSEGEATRSGSQASELTYEDAARLLNVGPIGPDEVFADPDSANSDYLAEYFPGMTEYDQSIPLPHDVLGFAPGEMHLTPETLLYYAREVAAVSPSAKLEIIGYSHEKRPLAHLYISSPENIANLEEIRQRHVSAGSSEDYILVLKLAYSIHGDEPSGANAVPLIAYYLTASTDPWVEEFLERTVVIIEPTQNPDGMTRYAQWANSHRANIANADPMQRNKHAGWPGGRTNHYWFDLNRDWIFVVHPESRARIEQYHRWKPHVLGDYHEMAGDTPSYFFQPGHPKRTNPLTLDENQRITASLAKFHAAALDRAGQDYFSGESFDDFYYGKGSAYPDMVGGIGLLFEQTASRGQVRDFDGEKLTFRQTISNQITTSFSLMKGADAMRDEIIAYRFAFRDAERQRAASTRIKGFVFSDDDDPARAHNLVRLLATHQIAVYELSRSVTRDGVKFEPGHAWIVPTDASQYGLVTSLFETRTVFEDNVFYDVSTWNLPTAFNLPYGSLDNVSNLLGNRLLELPQGQPVQVNPEAVAYAIPWNQLEAPRLLEKLLANDVFPRVAAKPFGGELIDGEHKQFAQGTIIVRLRDQDTVDAFQRAVSQVPSVSVTALASGLTADGPDLGSRDMKGIYPVRLALIVGEEVSTSEAGSLWHFIDSQIGAPVTLLDATHAIDADLSDYTHILMVDGAYTRLSDISCDLKEWVQAGGVLVAQKYAVTWVHENLIEGGETYIESCAEVSEQALPGDEGTEEAVEDEGGDAPVYRAYQDFERDNGDRLVRGSVFQAEIDLTHPFSYGIQRDIIPLFRTWNKILEPAIVSYDTPVRYTETPLVSGFVSETKLEELAGTPAVAAHRTGEGHIVTLADDLVFRGIWHGSERIYANIIYFTQTIEDRSDE